MKTSLAHRTVLLGILVLGSWSRAHAAVEFAHPFTDCMVLQRGMPVPVWGTAGPGEAVTIEFGGQSKATVADAKGVWMAVLDPLEASETDRDLTARGRTTATISEVLVGEVWLCSGQSNMQTSLERVKTLKYSSKESRAETMAITEREVESTTPGIRLLLTTGGKSKGQWKPCAPEALKNTARGAQGFSAVGYFFGKHLRAELHVPIGLIQGTEGGTRIELWTPPQAYRAMPAFAKEAEASPLKIDGVEPGKWYDVHIKPLVPFAMRGVLWYQGESNCIGADSGPRYADKMQALIQGWREAWKRPDLPFYYVQLPPLNYSTHSKEPLQNPESLPYFREGQTMALRIPGTAMVVTTDLATANDIHISNKWDVGKRLALVALAKTYGRTDVVCSGPVFRSMTVQGGECVLTFDSSGSPLTSRDGKPLTGFTIAGADRVFVKAQASIQGDTVIVSSPAVKQPVAVRFAWHEESRPNFSNQAGLPAVPFRTDDWPVIWFDAERRAARSKKNLPDPEPEGPKE